MNKTLMAAGLAVVLGACNSSKKSDGVDTSAVNPFFTEYTTPFGVPPFEQIKVEHYKPAFLKGMEEQTAEVEAIVNNPDKATFENTIVALADEGYAKFISGKFKQALSLIHTFTPRTNNNYKYE